MAIRISDRIQAMAASATLAMSQKSSELRAAGVDVINLSVGEPDFDTPEHIKEAAKEAINKNITRYPPVAGYADLREAIAEKLRKENGLNFSAAQVVVSAGAKHSLNNAILAMINPGDEVVIPVPAWVSYIELVKLAGGVNVLVPAGIEQDFKVTPAQLEAALTERTRMVLLCSPSNPTGSVYTREELQGLVEVLARHPQVAVLSDEIYEHIDYSGAFTSLASFPEIADRVVVVNGVSKAYAMTGWRLGYACGPEAVIKIMTKIHQSAIMSAPTTSQYAAITALKDCDGEIERMRNEYNMRRRLVVKSFNDMGLSCFEPRGAFYAFPCIKSSGMSSEEFCTKLLEQKHVAIIPGNAFGASGEGYARVSYAYSVEHLMEAIRRIREFLNENCK